MDPVVVPLRSRRRQRASALQKVQHAVPAAGLTAAGVHALATGVHGLELALAIVEVVTSVLLVGAIVQSFRAASARGRERAHGGHGIDWADVWAAGVLFAEAAERWHLTHHIARPTIVTGLVTLGLGLFHGRIAARQAGRRVLRVDDTGVYVRARPFRGLHARWTDIAHISVTGDKAEIRTRAGRVRRLDFADLEGADTVRAALGVAQLHLNALATPRAPG
jgi:hypothetical protein